VEHARSYTDKRSVLIVVMLANFLTPIALSGVNVALPTIGKQFIVDAVKLSWVSTAFSLATAVFLVPLGKVADMYGRNRIFLYGTWVFTISSFLLGMSSSVGMLICLRTFQGLGAAMFVGTSLAIVVSAFPIEERGRVVGITGAAVYLGISVGPFLGGLLTQYLGWRGVFFVTGCLSGAMSLTSTRKLLREESRQETEPFDLIGSLLYGATLFLVIYGFSLLPSGSGLMLICAGLVGLGLFVLRQTSIKYPVLDIRLFMSNRTYTLSNAAALIHFCSIFSAAFLLSFYLQNIKGMSPANAGLILMAQPIVQAIFSPLSGRLSDRFEPRLLSSLGMALTAVSIACLAVLNPGSTLGFCAGSLMLLGFGCALFIAPNSNAVMSSVETKLYGVASSVLATMRVVGQALSMGIATSILAFYMGRIEISPASYPLLMKSTKGTFALLAVLCAGGVFASLARGKVRK
jgi:EmrB/QacA subfamily drug resistance transporter